MSCLIAVKQITNVQIKKNGLTKSKQLMPNAKYIINNPNNKQVIDLKSVKCLIIKPASPKDESCFEHIDLA